MAMVFQFKPVFPGNLMLGPLDRCVLEFRHSIAHTTDQMVMVGFGARAFIVRIAARAETLRHHARLQKDRKIAVNRIPRNLKPLLLKTGDEAIHIKMPGLAFNPRDQPETLTRQTAPLAADKALELFLMLDHKEGFLEERY